MAASTIEWSVATGQAGWIGPRLSPFGSDRVDSVIPAGFAAYARLLHPAWRSNAVGEQVVRWQEVADWSGLPLQRRSQFHDIALPGHTPAERAPWDSQGPAAGSLTGDDAAALVELLAKHTADEQRCWFCLWGGYGWEDDTVPSWVHSGPQVQLPGRDYLLYAGPVEAALAFVDSHYQTPNLWWPEDRSWCVASEIDLPWTYLAGSEALIENVLAEARLEALPARADDPIQLRVRGWHLDLINDTAAELAEDGAVTVTTSVGCVYARLKRPTWWRRGWLHTSSETANGFSTTSGAIARQYSSSGAISRQYRFQDALLHELRWSLTRAILKLVER